MGCLAQQEFLNGLERDQRALAASTQTRECGLNRDDHQRDVAVSAANILILFFAGHLTRLSDQNPKTEHV